MNDDESLISRLCVRAGIIMEDASPLAVTMPGEESERWGHSSTCRALRKR